MSLSYPNTPVSQQDLQDFYHKLLPYIGGMPEIVVNKFSKGDLYSTDEKMIGQWIDGKPLYQKTIEITPIIKSGSQVNYSHNISNIDNVVNYSAFFKDTNGTASMVNSSTNSSWLLSTIAVSRSAVSYQIGSGWSYNSLQITIQYTKTTDTSISIGSETDYSTDEKIVGTWVDGKPIYQRTLNLGTLSLSTSITHEDIDVDTWNIDTLIDCKGGGIIYKGSTFQGNVIFPQNYINDLGVKISIKISTNGKLLVIYKTVSSSSATYVLNNAFLTIQYTKNAS